MGLKHDLADLVAQGIIQASTAQDIEAYYTRQKKPAGPRLLIAFGILGSLLVGAGVLLIIAHNWDNFSKQLKTLLAFIPLLAGQGLTAYSIFKLRSASPAWKESSAVLLIFGLGACLALVSQIYQLPGDLAGFLVVWIVLALPVILVTGSSMASLLVLVGSTWYACESGYWSHPTHLPVWFPLFILPVLWHYRHLILHQPRSNFTKFHHALFPAVLFIVLGTLAGQHQPLLFLTYMSLAGFLFGVGRLLWHGVDQSQLNSYQALATLVMVVILLMLSFSWFWEEYARHPLSGLWTSREMLIALVLIIGAGLLMAFKWIKRTDRSIRPWELVPTLFLIIFISGLGAVVWPQVAINVLLLALGIFTLVEGAKQDHLPRLNFGLLIITALLICRFFDLDLSFVTRGLLFVGLGLGFFLINYRMLKRKSL